MVRPSPGTASTIPKATGHGTLNRMDAALIGNSTYTSDLCNSSGEQLLTIRQPAAPRALVGQLTQERRYESEKPLAYLNLNADVMRLCFSAAPAVNVRKIVRQPWWNLRLSWTSSQLIFFAEVP